MADRLLATDDGHHEAVGLFGCGSLVPRHGGQKAHTLRRGLVNLIICMALFALFLPLVSCELDGGYKELSADELKKFIDDGPAILIVDNRSEYEYSRGHIPKAINIPQEQFTLLNTLLPKDKGFPVVFYCTGYG